MANATLEIPQALHQLNGMHFIAQRVTMVSIFPIDCIAYRNFGPTMEGAVNNKYYLPAAQKGAHSKLVIWDAFERQPDFNASQAVGKIITAPVINPCRSVARDLFKEWVENRLGCASGHRPGISLIAGDDPTKEELAMLVPQQEAYARALYHEANGSWEKHDWRNITSLHREMAKWAGLKAKWIEDYAYQETKKCSECRQDIPSDANICFICRSAQKAKAA